MCVGSNYRQWSQKVLAKKVTFEESPEGEGGAMRISVGKVFPARGNCKCKVLVCSRFSKKIRRLERSEQVGVQ